MAIEISDLCKHGLAMRCPKCAYEIGFKAGQESAIESYEKYKKPALIEAMKFQARQDEIIKMDKFLGSFVFWCGKDKQEILRKWEELKKKKPLQDFTVFELKKNHIKGGNKS